MSTASLNNSKPIETDIAIVGGGMAGSTVAVMLQNANIDALLIDPHFEMPKDFKCEKFDRGQMLKLEQIGIADNIYKACTEVEDIWIARQGKLVNKMSYPHYGFSYETAINAIRDYLDKPNKMLEGKVKSIKNSATRQILTLADGREVSARLVVLANGLNPGIRKQLNVEQTMLSKQHEMAIGFDIEPTNGNVFEFETFTFWPEKASKNLAYFTAFKSDDSFRVNTFGYWAKDDAFLSELQEQPEEALAKLMPSLNGMIGDFKVTNRVHVRPIDLYQNTPTNCDGVVFVGDAYATSCPGAGTGTSKAVADADILCTQYIPKWLSSNEISAKHIAEFYENEDKLQSDATSIEAAHFLKSISLEEGIIWDARRWMRYVYHLSKGRLNSIKAQPKLKAEKKAA